MSTKIDCNICCESFTPKQIVTCCSCQFQSCKTCVKTQIEHTKEAACMNCKITFTKKFLTDSIGVTYVKTTWKKIEEDRLLEHEREQLTSTQPLVNWEKEFRRQKSRLRFGERMTISERPTESSNKNIKDFFPCPNNSCRGFIEPGVSNCSVCNSKVCRTCRELTSTTETHLCNLDTIQTLSMLRQDSRSCPKCAAVINRSSGCNHMFCTQCRTHFDWETGNILKQSTNGHYNHLESYARNLVTRNVDSESSDTTTNQQRQQQDDCSQIRQIPADTLLRKNSDIPEKILRVLYDDYEIIRFAADSFYDEGSLNMQLSNTLTNLRVSYLMNDIDEATWKSRVYSVNKSFEYRLHCSQVFQLYTQGIFQFQHRLYDLTHVSESEIENFIQVVNRSFASLADEYNSNVSIQIKKLHDPESIPAIIR